MDTPLCFELSWIKFHQYHVSFLIIRGKTLAVNELLHLLDFLIQVGLGSIKLFLPSLGKMVGSQNLYFKNSR